MTYFPNPTNLTTPSSLISYINNVTSVTDISGTTIYSGFFAIGILVTVFSVMFMGLKNRFTTEVSLITALFITTVVGYIFVFMGLVDDTFVTGLSVLLAIGIFILYIHK